jgi:hypothetical protein
LSAFGDFLGAKAAITEYDQSIAKHSACLKAQRDSYT